MTPGSEEAWIDRAIRGGTSLALGRSVASPRHRWHTPVGWPSRRLGLRVGRPSIPFGIAAFALGFAVSALAVSLPTRVSLSYTNHFSPPVLQTVDDVLRVTVEQTSQLEQAGEPRLPFRSVRFLLPAGYRVVHVQARLLAEPIQLAASLPVELGRTPVSSARSLGAAPLQSPGSPEPTIHTSPGPFPAGQVELASVQHLAGHGIAVLRVYPLQYLPARRELVFVPTLAADLTLEPVGESGDAPLRRPDPSKADQQVLPLVDNPEAMVPSATNRRIRPMGGSELDYLLLTRTNLAAAFQPLLDHRARQGFQVKIESIETITNLYAGVDAPEKIRNYLRYAYTNWGVTCVLLGGDTQVVPCRYAYAYAGAGTNPSIPCDLYYACLDGTWNDNGNSRWGEPTDGLDGGDVDLLAELNVGRAPVETAEEVQSFVEKTLRYEIHGPVHPADTLLLAEFLGSFPAGPAQGGAMFDPLLPYFLGQQITWFDDRPGTTPQWNQADAFTALNQSPHFVIFNGHGTSDILIGDYTPVRMITTADLAGLTNAAPLFAYSVGCDVGQFDNDRFSPDCIGEELVKRPAHGAFAAVFNSRVGWFDPQDEGKFSGEFQKSFFDQLLTRGRTCVGEANQRSKHDLLGKVEASGLQTYRYCYYEITLFGDPATSLRAVPFPLRVTPEFVAAGEPNASLVLRWPSLPDRSYALYEAADPDGPYAPVAEDLPSTPPENTHTNSMANGGDVRFFRLESRDLPQP